MKPSGLRYRETGPLHRDFHRTTNGTSIRVIRSLPTY